METWFQYELKTMKLLLKIIQNHYIEWLKRQNQKQGVDNLLSNYDFKLQDYLF